jgi:serine/threonine protein kinase/Flp pilus assembly protein TadD
MPSVNGSENNHRLGDFEIVREVGRGGMGVVYEAVQTSLNRRVALKVLGSALGLTPRAVDRFHREAEAAAKLHHTNIVPVYATGEHDGTHFYAMELIDGPSLDRVVKQLRQTKNGEALGDAKSTPSLPVDLGLTGPYVETSLVVATPESGTSSGLSADHQYFDRVAGMIADVADALDHAHKNNVLHRDIKPSNLLLAPDGRLSINDFGLARMLEQPGMTMTGEFVGTPAYMSPEQITSGRIPIDHRTDIYSLGATLYELCTLQAPFVGERRDQLLAQVVQKEPKPPRSINKRVPLDLETICLKCLEKDPDRRYQSAKELADDLRRFVNRFAISAKRVGPLGRVKKWMRRNPAVTGLLAAMLLAIGAAGVFAWRAHEAEQQARIEKRREVIRNGMVEAMAGNFAGVDKAVEDAIALDADTADVLILRGFSDLHNGRIPQAVAEFEDAVKLRPQSVMARAILTNTYLSASNYVKAPESYRILLELTPQTPEDLLFKGLAVVEYDASGGLKLIEEAMQTKQMNIGFLLRAGAREYLLYYSKPSLENLDLTLRDASTAREILRDHPTSLVMSLQTQMAAVNYYGLFKLPEKRAAAFAEAEKLAERLAGFPDNVEAAKFRCIWQQFRAFELGTPLVFSPDISALRERTGNRHLTYLEGDYLFRQGKDREAIAILRTQRGYHYADLVRFLATLNSEEFAAEGASLLNGTDSGVQDGLKQYATYLMRLAYGRSQEATERMRTFLDSGGKLPTYIARWDEYFHSDAANREDALLRAVGDARGEQSRVFNLRGLGALAAGNREEAKRLLRQAAEIGHPDGSARPWSSAILERMALDSDWPKSIPAKK